MRLLVGVTIGPKDVGDLHPLPGPVPRVRPGTHGSPVHKPGIVQEFQRRRRLEQMLSGDMKVPEGGLDTGMPHQALDGMEVHPGLQEMGRERMPE